MSTVLIILIFLLYFKIFTWYRHDNYWDIQEGVWKRNQNISYRRCQCHTSKADYVIITRRRDRGIEKYLIFGWNLFLEYNVVVGCWAMGKFFSFKVRSFFTDTFWLVVIISKEKFRQYNICQNTTLQSR